MELLSKMNSIFDKNQKEILIEQNTGAHLYRAIDGQGSHLESNEHRRDQKDPKLNGNLNQPQMLKLLQP